MQCTLISGTILVIDQPIIIFPIDYMYQIEQFCIKRCLLSTYWTFYMRSRRKYICHNCVKEIDIFSHGENCSEQHTEATTSIQLMAGKSTISERRDSEKLWLTCGCKYSARKRAVKVQGKHKEAWLTVVHYWINCTQLQKFFTSLPQAVSLQRSILTL